MGQAKRNGTFEQRKAAAIARREALLKPKPETLVVDDSPHVGIIGSDSHYPRRSHSPLAVAMLVAMSMGGRR